MIGDRLLACRSKISAGRRTIIVTDLRPQKEKDIPVILVPGWGGTAHFYEKTFFALRDAGRRVIGVDGRVDGAAEPLLSWPPIVQQKSGAVIRVMDTLGIPTADLLGQSAGAFTAVGAALSDPHRFRNMALVNPTGLCGPLPLLSTLFHWAANNATHPLTRRAMIKNSGLGITLAKTIFGNPAASFAELRAVLRFSLVPAIDAVRSAGIRTAILYGEDDTIIPARKLLPNVGGADVVLPMPGPHGTLILVDEASRIVARALADLAHARGIGKRGKNVI